MSRESQSALTMGSASSESFQSTPSSDDGAEKLYNEIKSRLQHTVKEPEIQAGPQKAAKQPFIKECKQALEEAKLEAFLDAQYKFFIPRCRQAELISLQFVLESLVAMEPSYDSKKTVTMARGIIKHRKALFATLICTKNAKGIFSLVEDGVADQDLPLTRDGELTHSGNPIFKRQNGEIVNAMISWKGNDLLSFGATQYMLIAPVLTYGQNGEYDHNIILPFLKPKGQLPEKPAVGGHSQVFKKAIHKSHHDFWDHGTPEGEAKLVAIKQLDHNTGTDFDQEYEILTRLGSGNHRHKAYLVKLLGTFKHGSNHHLIFHWATSNLRDFWLKQQKSPIFKDWIFWTLKQMTGIAGALSTIHDFRPTQPFPSELPNNTSHGQARLSVKNGEKVFGRHGDIKPENFLYFNDDQETHDEKGILQISDFGLGRFHGRESRSAIQPGLAHATPTYEPPECQLGIPVSRKYDIWSLGCVYLEFLTWILLGSEAVKKFSDSRGGIVNRDGVDDDKYFEIPISHDGPEQAKVKEKVLTWVDKLRKSEHASELIHNLLMIIMTDMLVVDQDKRINSNELRGKLKKLQEECMEREDFMLVRIESDISIPPRIPSPRNSSTWPQVSQPRSPQGPQIHVTLTH